MTDTRSEHDSMGQMQVPAAALYGAQTARAVENFPVSGWTLPPEFISALGAIKLAAALANQQGRRLDETIGQAIADAAREVMDNKLNAHFPIDVFQTGSGTSSNMNANEVIANRAIELMGGRPGDKTVHPNDHVNMGQSSNDVFPTALHVATAVTIARRLLPALKQLIQSLADKAREFDDIVKIGRTHLMDAVPIRLGQEFSGYAAVLDNCLHRLAGVVKELSRLAIGGTAVGTGINTPPDFAGGVCRELTHLYGLRFTEATNHFAAQSILDTAVAASGALKNTALTMGKIASDIRLLGSGPRCGLGELTLPATQPGSSIMPGKVNPVICESVIQVACQVVGCDAAVAAGATGGVGSILELNVAMPMIAWNLLTAVKLLANVAIVLDEKCVRGLQANAARCESLVEQSLAMVTILAPKIGYDAAAKLAKEAHETGKTIRQLCLEKNLLEEQALTALLDARKQTEQ